MMLMAYAATCGAELESQRKTAYSLLFKAIKNEFGIVCGEGDIKRDEYGKPYLAGYPQVFFSLSHAHCAALCLVSDAPCGIDAERSDREIPERVQMRYFGGITDDAVREWTALEAKIKLSGKGLADAKNPPKCAVKHYAFCLDGVEYTAAIAYNEGENPPEFIEICG